MEICIAVADWARGLTTWVLDVPGGEGTGATRRKPTKHVRRRHKVYRVSPSGSTASIRSTGSTSSRGSSGSTGGSTSGSIPFGRGAGMVVGWG
ncbi:hypothetical protein B6E66_30825 [Streptomyces maremycinicus]|nr:hypothetical protein B6E66_30825 [Streptomyces sp. B9173]